MNDYQLTIKKIVDNDTLIAIGFPIDEFDYAEAILDGLANDLVSSLAKLIVTQLG